MEWRDGLQMAVIAILAAIGTALVAVGAYGSGVVMLLIGVVWFVRLYRTGV